LEADLKLHALEVIESGKARAVEYDMRGPDDILFGIGAGCEGAMRVLLEPANRSSSAAAALTAAGASVRAGTPTCLIAIHESTRLPLGTYGIDALPAELGAAAAQSIAQSASREIVLTDGAERLRAFVDFLPPSPHLLICGAGPDAEPVVGAARTLGWRVSVFDHRPAYATAVRFPGASVTCADPASLRAYIDLDQCHAAVVMSHHLASDTAYLRALSAAGTPGYVGLLGPAARRERIAQELGAESGGLRGRLRSPVGIAIGAVTPESIALAIVAEVHAWLADRLK
jgi:xanthine/CO dehydrogenase XdhC/CoxF family maturation factor